MHALLVGSLSRIISDLQNREYEPPQEKRKPSHVHSQAVQSSAVQEYPADDRANGKLSNSSNVASRIMQPKAKVVKGSKNSRKAGWTIFFAGFLVFFGFGQFLDNFCTVLDTFSKSPGPTKYKSTDKTECLTPMWCLPGTCIIGRQDVV